MVPGAGGGLLPGPASAFCLQREALVRCLWAGFRPRARRLPARHEGEVALLVGISFRRFRASRDEWVCRLL